MSTKNNINKRITLIDFLYHILFLHHELEELRYMQKHKCNYETAHAFANRRFNWEKEIDKIVDTDEIDPKLLI